jgi:uncharacterized Zn finger protein (UPF0148 family)
MTEELRCQSCGAWLEVGKKGTEIVQCAYCGGTVKIKASEQAVQAEYSRQFTTRLYRAIDESFTTEEMKELVVLLNGKLSGPYRLDYDDIPGNNQRSKALALVQWCERRMILQDLVDVVVSFRPTISLE